MAKLLNPLSSENARGKFGNVIVFTGWRTIKVARSRVTPTNPRSTRQLAVRAIMSSLSTAWASLTSGQVEAWNDYAATVTLTNLFGDYRMSGFNAYQRLNFFVVDDGNSANASPPTTAFKGNLSAFAAAGGGSSGEVDLTWTVPSGGAVSDIVDVWRTAAMPNANRTAQESDFRHDSYEAGNSTGVTVGSLTPDAWYWFRARFVMVDGRAGLFLQDQAQATT